jgi:tubulin---tyrosine ligase
MWEAAVAAGATAALLEYEDVDWEVASKSDGVVVSNFCVRKGLGRKANFARSVTRHLVKCKPRPTGTVCPLAAGVPATAVIDTVPVFHARPSWMDFRSALAEATADAEELLEGLGPAGAAILKPSLTNKGAEIAIVRTMEEVVAAVRAARDIGQWVLQRYIDPPLLVDGRKFHLRAYVLATGALRGYLFTDGLALLAAHEYAPLTAATAAASDAHVDTYAHITNTCVNAGAAGFDEGRLVRTISELPAQWVADGTCATAADAAARLEAMRRDMAALTAHCFAAVDGDAAAYMPLAHGFELYGVDFMVDAAWRVWVLEWNPTPDIKQTGARLDGMIARMVDGAVALALDARLPAGEVAGSRFAGPPPAALGEIAHDWELVYASPR